MCPKRGDRVWSPVEASSRVWRLRNGNGDGDRDGVVEDRGEGKDRGKGWKKEVMVLAERWRCWILWQSWYWISVLGMISDPVVVVIIVVVDFVVRLCSRQERVSSFFKVVRPRMELMAFLSR